MLNIRTSLPISCALALLGACGGGSATETSDASSTTTDMAAATTDMTTGPTTTDMTTGPTTTDPSGDGDGSVEPVGTSLFLQVFDTNGNPIPIAAVTFDGVTRATDGAGQILFEQLAPGRFSARVEAYGYAAASAVMELPEGAHGGLELRLLPLGDSLPFDADAGGTLERGAVRVTIPPQALVDANGEAVTGMVEATIVPLDPTSNLSASPGPLAGISAQGGGEVGLESVFMAEVSLWQAGDRLQLKPGAKATLEMVLPESLQGQYVDGDTVPAWWFDLDAGIWKEDGAGTMGPSQSQPGKLAWTAEVEHFTWWNCDKPWTDKNCFDVLVVDSDGDPLVHSSVTPKGVSYYGFTGEMVTGLDGHACVDFKLGGKVDLYVGGLSMPAAIKRVTGVGPASTCAGMGAACGSVVIMVPDDPFCVPGARRSLWPCPSYKGPADTRDVGVCQADANFCNAQGTAWLGCSGAVLPTPEDCNTPFDEDCDGQVNEDGPGCNCLPGSMEACYTGPIETIDVGVCRGGLRVCDPDGIGYGPCVGQVVPTTDVCATSADDDCDPNTSCFDPPIWQNPMDGTAEGVAYGVAADDAGNIIATGTFSGALDLGAGPLNGQNDVFLAKFDADGDLLWNRQFGDGSVQSGQAVAADGAGNIILAGSFQGTIDLGGGALVSAATDGFVAKFNAAGAHLWSKRFARAAATEVAVGPSGNIVVTGTFEDTTDLGGGVLLSAGDSDMYIVELSPAGGHVWSKSFGNSLQQEPPSLVVDSSEEIVLSGGLFGTIDFGGGPLTADPYPNVFVARFETDGDHAWSEDFGDGGLPIATGLALDPDDNIVVSTRAGAIDFGGGLLGPGGVVARLSPAGVHQWSANHPLPTAEHIAVDGAGNVASADSLDVAKIDSDGGLLWNRRIPPPGSELYITRIVFDAGDNPIVAGQIAGSPFIAKLAP